MPGVSAAARCPSCADSGHVCENHPDQPWGPLCCAVGDNGRCEHGACGCGAGEPCRACCTPVLADGTHPIGDAFTPSRPADDDPAAADDVGGPFPDLDNHAFAPDGGSHA
jgi:hypothetical protein